MTTTPSNGGGARPLALAAALVVLGTVLTVFYGLTSTFGGTPWLVAYVALALGAATVAARRAPTRVGVLVAVVLFVAGIAGYVSLLPGYRNVLRVGAYANDVVAWLTGRSVVLMLAADLWAVSVAPAPVFLTWYLALRGRYDGAALTGGATLGFFVLTGDLGGTLTLVGMAGLLGLVGFGAVATSAGGWRQLQEIGLIVGVAMLLTRLVQVVPASGVASVDLDDGEGGQSLERLLLSDPDRMRVGGSPTLSPTPRFTVEADEQAYWHARSFDRYTGRGWRRTDRALEDGPMLTLPPSAGTTLEQTFTVESSVGSMPAAWRPVRLGFDTRLLADVTPVGNLEPESTLQAGTRYEVVSEVPGWTAEALAATDRNYPGIVEERYNQLPGDLPDRLVDKTDEITADAGNPYETAIAIQRWLTENKRYTLSVEPQDWDVADAFVFSLDAGFCIYFATAMAVMLRTQGVPARFVVGYAPGERLGDGEWLVRGYHSHAWVEVYFSGIGWVTFDPTPAGPRQRAQQRELERTNIAAGSQDGSTPGRTPTVADEVTASPSATADGTNTSTPTGNATDASPVGAGGRTQLPDTPTREGGVPEGAVQADDGATTAGGDAGGGPRDRLWLVGALVTLAFGSVRLGYAQSAFRSVWLRWQPRSDDPDADVERALARLEYHLSQRFRSRREGETHQQYLVDLDRDPVRHLDERAWRVLDAYQESRYGEGVDRARADEAVAVVDDIVRG